jgi:hypothetical protein
MTQLKATQLLSSDSLLPHGLVECLYILPSRLGVNEKRASISSVSHLGGLVHLIFL